MYKIILVGGFGFIGKNIIEALYEKYEIIVIGRKNDDLFRSKYPKVIFYKYEFLKDNDLNCIISSLNPDYIINLVSIVTASRDMSDFQLMMRSNVEVLLELYESSKDCNNLKLFLQFGSGEEYGNICAPFIETVRELPSSPYALSKQLSTNTSLMLHNNYGFPIAIVRPGNLFGEYQDEDKFIPYILKKLRGNKVIETTKGEQKRDFIYASDFARGIEIVLHSYEGFIGEIFNLSSGESFYLKEIIEFCKSHIGSKSTVEYGKIPYRANEMMKFELDISKFKRIINSRFDIDLLESLARFIDESGGNNK